MKGAAYYLSIVLLSVVAFCFATTLEPWHQSWEGGRTKTDNIIQVALGDSRQLFARHFFLKADAYFHNGYYPTIYDSKEGYGQAHIAEQSAGGAEERELDYLGKPRDWIDAFSRNFFPSRHTHIGDSGCGHSCCQRAHEGEKTETTSAGDADHGPAHAHEHDHDANCEHQHEHESGEGPELGSDLRPTDEREIMPWLKVALELDPKRVETYVVAAFWLRSSLKQIDQAERLLRDGLQQVPGNPELLFELGRVLFEERKDTVRGRNVWELGLKKWDEQESGRENPNFFLAAQLLGNLATLEEKAGNNDAAIRHLERLAAISPNKGSIAKWIGTLRASAK